MPAPKVLPGEIVEMTQGGVDHAVEAVGRPQSAQLTVDVLRRGGTATILGMMPLDEKVGLSAMDLLSGKTLQGAIMGDTRFPRGHSPAGRFLHERRAET